MYGPAGLASFGVDLVLSAFDDAAKLFIAGRAVNRLKDVSFNEAEPSAHFSIRLFTTVAHNTGDAFARRRVSVQIGHDHRFTQIHGHWRVAPYTEVALRSVRELNERGVHRIEDGAQLCIGVGGNGPLFVMRRMAGPARRCRRIRILFEQCRMYFRGGCPRMRLRPDEGGKEE